VARIERFFSIFDDQVKALIAEQESAMHWLVAIAPSSQSCPRPTPRALAGTGQGWGSFFNCAGPAHVISSVSAAAGIIACMTDREYDMVILTITGLLSIVGGIWLRLAWRVF
jgi:hypothetical protein